MAYLAKEATRDIYLLDKPAAAERLDELIDSLSKRSLPLCLQAYAKTLKQFRTEILNWHDCHLTNAKSEAANNNVKRIKRLGYGFKNFQHFRNRVLLSELRGFKDRIRNNPARGIEILIRRFPNSIERKELQSVVGIAATPNDNLCIAL